MKIISLLPFYGLILIRYLCINLTFKRQRAFYSVSNSRTWDRSIVGILIIYIIDDDITVLQIWTGIIHLLHNTKRSLLLIYKIHIWIVATELYCSIGITYELLIDFILRPICSIFVYSSCIKETSLFINSISRDIALYNRA